MYDYTLEHVCTVTAKLRNPPEVIGPTPDGLRLNVYIEGGELIGSRVNGKVLPVGADWLTIRSDGVGVLDIRTTIQTNDGALIYLTYQGLADAGEDGYQRFIDGDLPPHIPIRGAPRFHTAHADYRC